MTLKPWRSSLFHRGPFCSSAPWAKVLAIGAVTGVVMTTAYAVGIDWVLAATRWTQLASGGEAVVFVLGVLGSLVGVRALTALDTTDAGPQRKSGRS